jgi:adenylate cyclase
VPRKRFRVTPRPGEKRYTFCMSTPSHHEIERKFLVTPAVHERLRGRTGRRIAQGYLADTPVQVRLRRVDDDRFILTVKTGQGLIRGEREIDLTREQFDALWPLTAGRRLQKTRYEIPLGDLTAEVDVYEGPRAGLIVVEVEFPDEPTCHAFQPPAWFGADVSADLKYSNRFMATE